MIPRATQTSQLLPTHDYVFNIILEGAFGVGKTSTSSRYVEGRFSDDYISPTIGMEFRTKTVNYDNKVIKLHLWTLLDRDRGCHRVLLSMILRIV